MRYVIAYAAAVTTFLAIDMVWLGYVARDLYRREMAHLIAPEFQVAPALVFYLMYVAGIVYFAIQPAFRSGQWTDAIVPGALLGLIAYGTYDFTNWAVMKNWPVGLTFIDLAWGTALTAVAASAGAYVALRFG